MFGLNNLGRAACAVVLLAATAGTARAQVFPPDAIPPADSTDPNAPRIRQLMDSIELTTWFLQMQQGSYLDHVADARADAAAGNDVSTEVLNLQADFSSYAHVLTESLYYDWFELLALDPSLLDLAQDYVEDRIAEVQEMIAAAEGLLDALDPDDPWGFSVWYHILNLESLIDTLEGYQLEFDIRFGTDDPVVRQLLRQLARIDDFIDDQYESYFDYVADANAAYAAEDESAFGLAVLNMQSDFGSYAQALTYSLYYETNALLTQDPDLLEAQLNYIDDRIAEVEAMIAAATALRNRFPAESGWYFTLNNHIHNMENLIGTLRGYQMQFFLDYAPVPDPDPVPVPDQPGVSVGEG